LLLNGHTISGLGPLTTNSLGIALYGLVSGPANVSVLGPGVVTGFGIGVFVNTEPCVVANVTVTQSTTGFGIFGGFQNNVLKGNTATANTDRGFLINGDNNVVKGNDSSGDLRSWEKLLS
jgi:parallel beta-helix repeat protein